MKLRRSTLRGVAIISAVLSFYGNAYALTPPAALALGQIRALSTPGQPLTAEVEIFTTGDAEVEISAVRAITPDDKTGGEYKAIYSKLSVLLEARGDKRYAVIKSLSPIADSAVRIVLLGESPAGRVKRSYTVNLAQAAEMEAPRGPGDYSRRQSLLPNEHAIAYAPQTPSSFGRAAPAMVGSLNGLRNPQTLPARDVRNGREDLFSEGALSRVEVRQYLAHDLKNIVTRGEPDETIRHIDLNVVRESALRAIAAIVPKGWRGHAMDDDVLRSRFVSARYRNMRWTDALDKILVKTGLFAVMDWDAKTLELASSRESLRNAGANKTQSKSSPVPAQDVAKAIVRPPMPPTGPSVIAPPVVEMSPALGPRAPLAVVAPGVPPQEPQRPSPQANGIQGAGERPQSGFVAPQRRVLAPRMSRSSPIQIVEPIQLVRPIRQESIQLPLQPRTLSYGYRPQRPAVPSNVPESLDREGATQNGYQSVPQELTGNSTAKSIQQTVLPASQSMLPQGLILQPSEVMVQDKERVARIQAQVAERPARSDSVGSRTVRKKPTLLVELEEEKVSAAAKASARNEQLVSSSPVQNERISQASSSNPAHQDFSRQLDRSEAMGTKSQWAEVKTRPVETKSKSSAVGDHRADADHLVRGSGFNVALFQAVSSIAPSGWMVYSRDSSIPSGKGFSWVGRSRNWVQVLQETLEKEGLAAHLRYESKEVEIYRSPR